MRIFLFPGQGSQEIGMAADLFKTDPAFRALVDRASQRVGRDLEQLCQAGPQRELARTQYLQPLLVCVALGYLRHLTGAGLTPAMVLGHSLGEIAALAASGIVGFETAVDMAAKRGELMEAVAMEAAGGMIAVTGPDREALLRLQARSFPAAQLVLANDNAPNQLVFSGATTVLDQWAGLVAAEKLGHCRRLAVAGPWHSPLMAPAREQFSLWLETIEFQAPRVPLVFNVTGSTENNPQGIRELVARSLVEPVRWRQAMASLLALPEVSFFEIGPGRVLSGLARANGFGEKTRIFNINNLRGLEMAARVC
jgi:[acyl-carrier-protein] S-malonyltransferase